MPGYGLALSTLLLLAGCAARQPRPSASVVADVPPDAERVQEAGVTLWRWERPGYTCTVMERDEGVFRSCLKHPPGYSL